MRRLLSLILLLLLWNQKIVSARNIELAFECETVLLGSVEGSNERIRLRVDELVQMAVKVSLGDPDLRRLLGQVARLGLSALNEEQYIGSSACQQFKQIFLEFQGMEGHSWIASHLQATLAEKLKIERVGTIQRDKRIHDTRSLFREMEFVTVPGGEFKMGGENEKVNVKLTHGLHVMTTKVTQNMWEGFMKSNPSHFKGRLNNPIENITWWSAVEFANRASKKFSLRPVWDMSKIKFKGSAEEGILEPEDEELAKTQILIDSGGGNYLPERDSNIYLSEGLRFGTDAEKEYLLRDLGRCNGWWPFGIRREELPKYAWSSDNARRMTHSVGTTKLFFTFSGTQTPLYDLIGNVVEWGDDYYQDKLSGGIDPRCTVGSDRVARPGSWLHPAGSSSSYRRFSGSPRWQFSYFGIRLLRTAR